VAQVREARARMPQMYEQAQQRLAELRAKNGGRYGDVDSSLDEAESILTGQPGWANYGGASYDYSQLSSRDLMYMWGALQNALQHAQVAEVSYTSHTAPSGGSSFGGGGGSSSWGGGGGSSFGGGGGGGGGSSSW
jgi:hypothetical protein